jgi:hypothetical protein
MKKLRSADKKSVAEMLLENGHDGLGHRIHDAGLPVSDAHILTRADDVKRILGGLMSGVNLSNRLLYAIFTRLIVTLHIEKSKDMPCNTHYIDYIWLSMQLQRHVDGA